MKAARYCEKPDRDVPAIRCGYPLPCPHHIDAIIDPAAGTVVVSVDAPPALRERLADIGAAIAGRSRKRRQRR